MTPDAAVRDETSSGMMPLSLLFVISVVGAMLALSAGAMYGFDRRSVIAPIGAAVVLLAVSGFLWRYRTRSARLENPAVLRPAILAGLLLGVLWMVEIGINNVVAPPLPARDVIDNIFWGVIALSILALSTGHAFRAQRILPGLAAGTWSGFASGLVACTTALAMIVFGMRFLTHDPLNVAEWAARRASSHAPSLAAYFAFETLAGAMLHLVVLGIVMGALLGAIGGVLGAGARRLLTA